MELASIFTKYISPYYTMRGTKKCSAGKFYRKTYTRKGRRIAGRCIRKQTTTKITSRQYAAATRRRMGIRMRGFRKTNRGPKKCPRGTILRNAYVRYTQRGTHVRVPASCIPDIGAIGKGLRFGKPGIGILKKGNLIRFGYQQIATMNVTDRRTALRKAVEAYGALTVWRKLNALSIYTRRTSPVTSQTVKSDMDWIRATWGIKAF
jgi:hypothetical protein